MSELTVNWRALYKIVGVAAYKADYSIWHGFFTSLSLLPVSWLINSLVQLGRCDAFWIVYGQIVDALLHSPIPCFIYLYQRHYICEKYLTMTIMRIYKMNMDLCSLVASIKVDIPFMHTTCYLEATIHYTGTRSLTRAASQFPVHRRGFD